VWVESRINRSMVTLLTFQLPLVGQKPPWNIDGWTKEHIVIDLWKCIILFYVWLQFFLKMPYAHWRVLSHIIAKTGW